MKYNGIELKEITEPQIFDPPKKMLVWGENDREACVENIYAIGPSSMESPVRAISDDGRLGTHCYKYCAEIPKPRRATNREFSRWLAKGYGECRSSSGCADTAWMYETELDDKPVVEWTKARKWDDSEWHEPTVEYCKELKPEEQMNNDGERLKNFIFSIIEEHKTACRKHPVFCDMITSMDKNAAEKYEDACKMANEKGPYKADLILDEEIAEAKLAYLKGEKKHALQELAQCGAVILRIMEKIDNEME